MSEEYYGLCFICGESHYLTGDTNHVCGACWDDVVGDTWLDKANKISEERVNPGSVEEIIKLQSLHRKVRK